MLEYLYQEGAPTCSKEPIKVRLDGRQVGEIRKVEGGYQYFPKGQRTGGPVLPTVTAVQRSLADDA
jgi:hypothetical protein